MNYQKEHNRNENVIDSSGSNSSAQPFKESEDTIDLHEFISLITRRRWVILATIAAVFALGVVYTYTRKPVYESTAEIVVNTRSSASPVSVSGSEFTLMDSLRALTQSRSTDTQAEIISSDAVLRKAYNLFTPQVKMQGFRDIKIPLWAYDIAAKKDTDVITVTCRSYNSASAANLANNIADTYFKDDLDRSNQSTRLARTFSEDQMATVSRDLKKAMNKLAEYKRKSGLLDIPSQFQQVAQHVTQLQMGLETTEYDFAGNQRAMGALRQQLASQREQVLQATSVTANPQFQTTIENLNQLEIRRAAAMQEYTPTSLVVKQIDGQISSERARLKKIADSVVSNKTTGRNLIWEGLAGKYADSIVTDAMLKKRLEAINRNLDELKTEGKKLPEKERRFLELSENVQLLQKTYQALSEKYYALLLTERSMLPAGQLVSPALPSEIPAYPQVPKNLAVFLVLGIMLSVISAIVSEKMDERVHDQSLVEQATGLPILAVVPFIQDDIALISEVDQHSPLLESYRILRSNIAFSAIDREIKLLAVSGPGRGEGKSTTAANLAIAMAMDGRKVLIVDCDMRRPSMHRLFGVSSSIGLTNVITGNVKLEDAIKATKVENLSVLPAGALPPNPPEVLNSTHSRELFRKLAQDYDMVVLDCPPCAGLSDVQVVSTIVDGLVLVVAMNQTVKPHLCITMQTLAQVDAPLIGTVLNKMDLRHQGYYYYSYSYREDGNEGRSGHKTKLRKSGKSASQK